MLFDEESMRYVQALDSAGHSRRVRRDPPLPGDVQPRGRTMTVATSKPRLAPRLSALTKIVELGPGRLDQKLLVGGRSAAAAGRRPAQAVVGAHRGRARGRHRQRQVVALQRHVRAGAVAHRRTPAHHGAHARLRLGPRRRGAAARLAADPVAAPLRQGQRARQGREPAARADPARPARPRLHQGAHRHRGRPAHRPGRPGGVGARPAEVRRRLHPPPLRHGAGRA